MGLPSSHIPLGRIFNSISFTSLHFLFVDLSLRFPYNGYTVYQTESNVQWAKLKDEVPMNFEMDLNQIIPLVLSTSVSILAVCVSAYQTRENSKTKFNEFYLSARIKAYNELLEAAVELDVDLQSGERRDRRRLIMASQKAQIVSTKLTAEIISHFCAVYYDFIEATDKGPIPKETQREFHDALFLLTSALREEIMSQDKRKRALEKYLAKQEKKRHR